MCHDTHALPVKGSPVVNGLAGIGALAIRLADWLWPIPATEFELIPARQLHEGLDVIGAYGTWSRITELTFDPLHATYRTADGSLMQEWLDDLVEVRPAPARTGNLTAVAAPITPAEVN